MIFLTKGEKTLAVTASIIGIIQSIVWFAMSLICIVEYSVNTPPETKNSSSTIENFNYRLYHLYLDKEADSPEDTIVTPKAFLAFNVIYIILTAGWFVISCFQFNAVRNKGVNVPISFKDWAIVTWGISLEDVVLDILLGVDYNDSCLKYYHDPLRKLPDDEVCIDTIVPVIVIASRGFILWIVNVIIAFMLYKSARAIRNQEAQAYKGTFGSIMPIYNYHKSIPRVVVHPTPSLYSQQLGAVSDKNSHWNVNLRTAMDRRTPPPTPRGPTSPGYSLSTGSSPSPRKLSPNNQQRFFGP